MPPACLRGLAAASLVLAAALSCTSTGVGLPDAAFQKPFASWASIRAVKPGTEWVLLFAFLKNTSGREVKLRRVWLGGEGLGDVVEVFDVRAAPLPPLTGPRGFTPGGIYVTDPPTIRLYRDGSCNRQKLLPIQGFAVPPNGELRIAVFLRAVVEGHYDLSTHVVEYELGGRVFRQDLPIGMRGRVSAAGRPVPLGSSQRDCLHAGTPLAGVEG